MKNRIKETASLLVVAVLLVGCSASAPIEADTIQTEQPGPKIIAAETPPPSPFPNLQAEFLDARYKTTTSPFATFDFKNFTYPLPRGWQNPDGSDLVLADGRVKPVAVNISEEMSDEEKIERRAMRRIGMSHVITNYFDVTGDGQDEAIVILKVETTGAAIPQLVYIYEWKDAGPSLLWNFRTGDRADGGLKDMRAENGELVVELYGQDRFLLGEVETGKITGDEEQLCCPTFFTRTFYKWNGRHFLLQRKRLTFSVADPSAAPIENMAQLIEKQNSGKK